MITSAYDSHRQHNGELRMNANIFVRGSAGNERNNDVREQAHRMLGRLRRHVMHVEVVLDEQELATGTSLHRCTLRLRLQDGGDMLVHARGAGRDAALASAFRRARRELLRRRRATLRLSPWHRQPQPAMI